MCLCARARECMSAREAQAAKMQTRKRADTLKGSEDRVVGRMATDLARVWGLGFRVQKDRVRGRVGRDLAMAEMPTSVYLTFQYRLSVVRLEQPFESCSRPSSAAHKITFRGTAVLRSPFFLHTLIIVTNSITK